MSAWKGRPRSPRDPIHFTIATQLWPLLSFSHLDNVVVRLAVDQFIERIDTSLYRQLVHNEIEFCFVFLNFVFLEIQVLALAIQHADVNPIVSRDFSLLAMAVGPVFF